MKKMNDYKVDYIAEVITVTKRFAKAAGVLNSNEYHILRQLRQDNPTFTVEYREIKKKDGKKSYRNLTFKNMADYIIEREGKDSEVFKEFEKVKTLAKIQAGPYAYVKTWFLARYKDEFKAEEENTEEQKTA